jgi:hypothetical protein
LLDLVFGLAIRGQPGPLGSSQAAGRTWPVVRTIGRRRRPPPAGGTLPADDRLKSTNLVDREVLTMLQKRRYLPTRKRVVPPCGSCPPIPSLAGTLTCCGALRRLGQGKPRTFRPPDVAGAWAPWRYGDPSCDPNPRLRPRTPPRQGIDRPPLPWWA